MLIVDGEKMQFLSGFSENGQTKEHAYLLNSMGPKRLLVVVNKMDKAEWEESAFQFVKDEILEFF